MKKMDFMNALGAEDLKQINGGRIATNVGLAIDFHIHCIQPEPGTCSCSPTKSLVRKEGV
ncbi:MAG: hypothetical protein ACRC8J_02405 [Phocaeicola sp.]